jgi:hypothetical protein
MVSYMGLYLCIFSNDDFKSDSCPIVNIITVMFSSFRDEVFARV